MILLRGVNSIFTYFYPPNKESLRLFRHRLCLIHLMLLFRSWTIHTKTLKKLSLCTKEDKDSWHPMYDSLGGRSHDGAILDRYYGWGPSTESTWKLLHLESRRYRHVCTETNAGGSCLFCSGNVVSLWCSRGLRGRDPGIIHKTLDLDALHCMVCRPQRHTLRNNQHIECPN